MAENGQVTEPKPVEVAVPSQAVFTPKAEPVAEAYYLPSVGEDTTPAEAEQAIEAIKAEVGADAKHPYSNAHHFQHKKWVAVFTKLHEIKAKGGDGLSETTRACNAAMAGLAEKQNKLIARGEKQIAALEKLGIGRGNVPADLKDYDLKEYHLAIWRMQELNANDASPDALAELSQIMVKEAQSLRAEPHLAEAVNHFNQVRSSLGQYTPERCQRIAEEIIGIIYDANKAMYGGK